MTENKIPFGKIKFEYVKKRLNKLDAGYPEDKKFDTGFWYWKVKELKEENIEFEKDSAKTHPSSPMMDHK